MGCNCKECRQERVREQQERDNEEFRREMNDTPAMQGNKPNLSQERKGHDRIFHPNPGKSWPSFLVEEAD